jgi:hypothetical protein
LEVALYGSWWVRRMKILLSVNMALYSVLEGVYKLLRRTMDICVVDKETLANPPECANSCVLTSLSFRDQHK